MRKYAIVAGGLLLSLVLGATVFSQPVAWAAQSVSATIIGPLDGQGNVAVHEQGTANVSVTNSQLAVREQGTVPASQSGTWHVSVDGKPSVTSADHTARGGTYTRAPQGSGVFTQAVDADITGYRSVRVATNCFAGGDCANILVRVYSIAGGRSFLIDQFPMQNFLAQTRVFDVLGTTLAVQLQNNNPGAVLNIGVAVFGRAN